MKIISVILSSFIIVSCSQNQPKENEKIDSLSKPLTVEIIEIADFTALGNYRVEIDTAYFFARADSSTKMSTYLTKDDLTLIFKKNGEFGYAAKRNDSVLQPLGWIKLKYLSEIFFTPPKVIEN